jgi:hypothetical protein
MPQAPQFCASTLVFTQVEPQKLPLVHTQLPALQA